jgi:hypothetical protein
MKVKGILSLLVVAMAFLAIPAMAQDRLGDLVAQGGYDWLIGRWVTTTEDGQESTYEQNWILDRHAIDVRFQMGDLEYQGMTAFIPYREEVIEVGADNQGGTWEGAWRDEYGSAVLRMEQTKPNGEVQKMEIVHAWGGNEAMKVTMYRIDSSGYRDSQPLATLTYKRQKAEDSSAKSASQSSWSAYMTLGDLLSQYGYDSMIGQWRGHNDDANVDIDVQYKWALEKHAVLVDAQSGQFEYRGMIMLAPSGEEVVQFGADNMGGTWKSTWTEGYDGVTNRHEMRRPDGTTEKMEHVYSKLEKDSFKVTEYGVESSGYRASSPRGETTFKRRPSDASKK